MSAAIAVVESKDSAHRKLSKSKSAGRIDGNGRADMAKGVAPLDDGSVGDIDGFLKSPLIF